MMKIDESFQIKREKVFHKAKKALAMAEEKAFQQQ